MTSSMEADTTRQQVVQKHLVRGAIWGLLLGISLSMYAVLFAVIPFTDWVPLGLVAIAGVVIGVAWAYFAPPKKAKAETPPSVADGSSADVVATPVDDDGGVPDPPQDPA